MAKGMKNIYTDRAPEPIGPYSQAVETGGFIFTSMQLPIDPDNPDKVYGSVAEEAKQLIANLFAVIGAGGGTPASIVKTTLYMTDLNDFMVVNEVYADLFGDHEPARSVVNVQTVPKGYRLAMEAVAVKDI